MIKYANLLSGSITNTPLFSVLYYYFIMEQSITSQLSDNAIYQILEIIASEIDNIDDKELVITFEV